MSGRAGNYYPIMIDLFNKRCLVVGGGKVAERKIESLLAAKAKIVVVSPALTERINDWAAAGKVDVMLRQYEDGDTEGAYLVIAASGDSEVNERVRNEAMAEERLIGVVDKPESGSFILPASFTRGKLQMAVSTSGASPTLARDIVNELKTEYGPEYEAYVDFLNEFRLKVRRFVNDAEHRQALAREIVGIDVLGRIRSGGFVRFRDDMFRKLETEPECFDLEDWK